MSGKSVTFYFSRKKQVLYNFQDKTKEEGIEHYSNVITRLIEDYTTGKLPSEYYKELNEDLKDK
tara:strand:- start:589 stop:780 length:192 start_codon:yes stop_codon:yes gene_type:complete